MKRLLNERLLQIAGVKTLKPVISLDDLKRLKEEKKQTEYSKYFEKCLKKFNVSSPSDFESESKKKEFFDYVDKNWKAKNETD